MWYIAAIIGMALAIIMHDVFDYLESWDYQRHFED